MTRTKSTIKRSPEPATPAVADQLKVMIAAAERKGSSRYKIARLAAVSDSQLSRLISGQRQISLDTAGRIAAACGYKIVLTKIARKKIAK